MSPVELVAYALAADVVFVREGGRLWLLTAQTTRVADDRELNAAIVDGGLHRADEMFDSWEQLDRRLEEIRAHWLEEQRGPDYYASRYDVEQLSSMLDRLEAGLSSGQFTRGDLKFFAARMLKMSPAAANQAMRGRLTDLLTEAATAEVASEATTRATLPLAT